MPQETRRRTERKVAKIAIVVFVDKETDREGSDAVTVDVSVRGARIQSDLTLTPGQMVEVVPVNGSDPVAARVVWVGKPASELQGQAGLEFLDPFNIST
jgi:microcompartment protein CcmK/EutM